MTQYAGHARELAAEAAHTAQADGEPVRIWTAGGDGTFNEALTGAQGCSLAAVGCLPFGSGNDFLRTYGTREEFNDLDAQLAGGEVDIDLMQTDLGLSATIWRRRARCTGGLRHPGQVPAHPVLRRRDGLCTLHRQAALRPHRPERDLYHRR